MTQDELNQALLKAVQQENINLSDVRSLISQGANVNCTTGKDNYSPLMSITGKDNYTPLMIACKGKRDQLELVQLLLESNVNVDAQSNFGFTALLYACKGGNLEIVELLLEKGAVVSERALSPACKGGNLEIVKLLLEKGAVVSERALSPACKGGNLEIVKLLLEKGADASERALSSACEIGNLEIIELLLEKGCVVSDGVLLTAYYRNNLEIMEVLLSKLNADKINIINIDVPGQSLITKACLDNKEDIVKLLINKLIDNKYDINDIINMHTCNSLNLLMYNCKIGNVDIKNFLIDQGAEIINNIKL